ncbi:Glyoxylase, beta-lactamase superfamily II [Lentibacillus persicus]|uniref:Glyoxylase, beta-lactamase superfamily II n=1 Tax=Lentibacillus persicus TaxID=640948 RepID=A0A1I1U1Y4_9BACI|nr:MBL fold metallo-hydrolase [Lentibacillus persicus]SFD61850.1 Glyoxylase, beta-lactamase superfamily II [Lentibacillus persicus]
METMQIGRGKLTWLNGGVNFLDGGAMFGVVPKPLWGKKYPSNEKNQIELRTDPILVQIDGKNYLIESGIGNGKLTSKQLRNFGVLEESSIDRSLEKLSLTVDDINAVLMTHLHFDHACGLTRPAGDGYEPVFKNAEIYVSQVEWDEMRNPNIRSANTYWKMNWEPIAEQVETFEDEITITNGLKLIHTGGHSDGHSILVFEDGDETWLHMADIMATHAHQNKLWVMAYDDYPVTSVHEKEKWMAVGYQKQAWYTFYHDAYYRAIKFDESGNVLDEVKRERYDYE